MASSKPEFIFNIEVEFYVCERERGGCTNQVDCGV